MAYMQGKLQPEAFTSLCRKCLIRSSLIESSVSPSSILSTSGIWKPHAFGN